MTVTLWQLLVYAGAMAALWAVPGPVWVALLARTMAGGFSAAWPLAVGVAFGDLIWLLAAILGLSWIESLYGDFLSLLRWVAAVVFVLMGLALLRKPAGEVGSNSRLTRPGRLAGISVGLAAVIGNPKAMLFYMGALPGFFDLARLTWRDIGAIVLVAALVPMIGNLCLALGVDRARRLLSSPEAMRRLNLGSGVLLIGVGLVIPFL